RPQPHPVRRQNLERSGPMTRCGRLVGLLAACVALGLGSDDSREKAVQVARRVLDDARPLPEREALIKEHPELSAGLIAAMADGLAPGTKEEFRRIPWL